MADGVSTMKVMGEVHFHLTRGSHTLQVDALAVDMLDTDILAGTNFVQQNDVGLRLAKRQIILKGVDVITYGHNTTSRPTVCRAQVLRAPTSSVLPGEYIELALTDPTDCQWALEPRWDAPSNKHSQSDRKIWPPPQVIQSVHGKIRIVNTTAEPIAFSRHEQFCQVRPIVTPEADPIAYHEPCTAIPTTEPFSSTIALDPDNILPAKIKSQFQQINNTFDNVFNPKIAKYNGKSGNIEATVNMGPSLPPQRKGRLPQYNTSLLNELQQKIDELEDIGVFAKPEEAGVTVEYLNICFLIKKPSGGHRLVTSFGEVASYSKPQPSLMPNVDGVLRSVAQWKHVIVTDLLQAFYQIPLAKGSQKYCGIASPFKGIRVYQRCAMGMPGSETALEELMSRVLGELIQKGCVAKLPDGLYIDGNTYDELLSNRTNVLHTLEANNLRLSAAKTTICPKQTTILGWRWSQGTLTASPHKITALASVTPPTTIHGLRSFIGAYKVLSRVLKGYADLLHPFDLLCAGKASKDRITWSDELLKAFHEAQLALQRCDTITLPRASDPLWISTDASVKQNGIGATMYCQREGVLKLAGHFNAKLRPNQVTWLPCEVEALAIASALKHFAPYIIQSEHQCQVLTDSRPCVQAAQRLQRGEFSNSSRVSSFLSIISRYQVNVRQLAGGANLPSDFTSRHPVECSDRSRCQVCRFIQDTQDSVVCNINTHEILQGTVKMPFTNRAGWLGVQHDCPDLRRTHAHLQQGTRPNRKARNVHDVRRYLGSVRIAQDGLLIVRDVAGFRAVERIVVPRPITDGLLTALHMKFNHPSKYQLKMVFSCYFFALDLEKSIEAVYASCHHCNALKHVPKALVTQHSSPPPQRIGQSFACDVLKRNCQLILLLKETVSSYTLTLLIDSEKHTDLRDGIVMLVSQARTSMEPITIRVDPAPGFQALRQDPILGRHGISLDIGEAKNANKNPVAERAVQELINEILNIQPSKGPVSKVTLALATNQMNERIRHHGLSAKEIWTQRDQFTGSQLPLSDLQLINKQHISRNTNHPYSSKSKLGHRIPRACLPPQAGDLIYLVNERSKLQARDKYLVIRVDNQVCHVRKFTKDCIGSKIYKVPWTECYPIISNTQDHSIHEDSSESEDDPGIPPDISHPQALYNDEPIQDATPTDPQDESEAISDGPAPLRRSRRQPRPNPKYRSDLWVTESLSEDDSVDSGD